MEIPNVQQSQPSAAEQPTERAQSGSATQSRPSLERSDLEQKNPVSPLPQNRSSQVQPVFVSSSAGSSQIPEKQSFVGKLQSKMIEYRRVLRSTRKPNYQELLTVVKISGAGILLIGFIGFLTTAVKTLLSS